MALSEAILVCLTERPMSGYDLAKNFDASIGFFWRASHQQIYRELGKLREKGYVKSEEIRQVGKPNRIVHTSRHYDGKALSLNQKGKLIALEIGIEQEKQNIENLSVAIGKVRAL